MPRRSREEIRVEKLVNGLYEKHGNGVSVDVFDITKILGAGRDAAANGDDAAEKAVIDAIAKYRKN